MVIRPLLVLVVFLGVAFGSVAAVNQKNIVSRDSVVQRDYVPYDLIVLNCGSSDNDVDGDGRKWQGDVGTKFSLSSGNSISAKAEYQDPSLPSTVPYMTTRIFTTNSTYSFPVTPGRHWVRLHFYPAAYDSRSAPDAMFSVISGEFTLLHNFSAAITAQALTQAYILREFYMNVNSNTLNLTFAPSVEHKSAYAFVNGIEIISAPDIYVGDDIPLVGFDGQTMDITKDTMQLMYRLNVGGQFISPTQDSNLTRTWFDDTPYVFGAGVGVTFSSDDKVTIRYPSGTPSYTAPESIYMTARSMGPDPRVNQNYNLTWLFQVDKNFMYMIRLHFCELVYSRANQRVFDIYLNNQTAQQDADLILYLSGKDVAVYKDYMVQVSGDENLWVALHPAIDMKPERYDAILNGIEIFKVNDSTGNLAGPNPVPSPLIADEMVPGYMPESQTNKSRVIAGVVVGVVVCAILIVCLVVFYQKQGGCARTDRLASNQTTGSMWLPLYAGFSHTIGSKVSTVSGKSYASSQISSMAANLCRHFSFEEIRKGTKNFDESLVLGVGGFGKVYRGEVDGGIKVAIKRANPSSEQGAHEFQTEIEMLSKLRHRHLVSLIGYCEEKNEMILVYDYMSQGTLREHLYKTNNPPISWRQRLEICIGAARGLHYLHTGAKYTIIHRDVKTTNILLDDKFVAKVSDFGLSKTGAGLDQTHVSTMVKGSFGYLDPEYFRRQQLTDKSDVYSFGVVLFEVLCARPALNPSLPKEQVSLADWALHCIKKGTLEDTIDPCLRGKINPECLKKFIETAQKCLADHGVDRPAMGDVLWNLEFALQLQDGSEEGKLAMTAEPTMPPLAHDGPLVFSDTGSVGDESITSSTDDSSTGYHSSAVFSQLINPKGR